MQVVTALSLAASIVLAPANPPAALGKKIEGFTLKDFRGKEHTLKDFGNNRFTVVVFLGTECPLAKLYGARLATLEQEFREKGVGFVGLFPNQQDAITEIAHFARVHELSFPLLKDLNNVVADKFGATRTPEAFILDREGVVVYQGRIDDQYGIGYAKVKAHEHDLSAAIEDLLAGRGVQRPMLAATGCLIGRIRATKANPSVTYSNQISRVFQKRCLECHRPGTVAPFSLTNYSDAKGWAEMIKEVVEDRRMPPWHANPAHGKFSNDCHLSDDEIGLITRWVDDGAPEGDPKELPPPVSFPEGWRIPTPDVVLKFSRPIRVRSEGTMGYVHVVVDTNFTEDKWVQFAEAKPGNPAVVHHIIVFIHSPNRSESAPEDQPNDGSPIGLGRRWLVASAPGSSPMMLPDGMARLIPAGSRLVFQMHYTPNGSEQFDESSIALKFADPGTVKKQVHTRNPGQFAFRIPPHADNYKMVANHFFREDALIVSFLPHMHVRGKSFRYEMEYPNGEREILLDVPRYDFGWQNTYSLDPPKKVPAGTKMICTAYYDNSTNNLSNPNPNQSVTWGEQTWEEMMFGFFEMALADQDLTKPEPTKPRVERFLDLVKAGGVGLDDEERELARHAVASPKEFRDFFAAVRALAPQVDRVCVTSVVDGTLTVLHAAQVGKVGTAWAMPGFQRPAAGFALAKFAGGSTIVALADLAASKAFDLRLMARAFRSSAHVPVKLTVGSATVNFWSRDPDAFPKDALPMLQSIADEMFRNQRAAAPIKADGAKNS